MKQKSYIAIKDQFKELRLRDRQSKVNARDLGLIGERASDTLKILPKKLQAISQSQSPSPIRAASTIHIESKFGEVVHGDRPKLQTIEPRGSHDPGIFTSRQRVSPPPRIETLDGCLSMRESIDSV